MDMFIKKYKIYIKNFLKNFNKQKLEILKIKKK